MGMGIFLLGKSNLPVLKPLLNFLIKNFAYNNHLWHDFQENTNIPGVKFSGLKLDKNR
jgi:hypothetical protein